MLAEVTVSSIVRVLVPLNVGAEVASSASAGIATTATAHTTISMATMAASSLPVFDFVYSLTIDTIAPYLENALGTAQKPNHGTGKPRRNV